MDLEVGGFAFEGSFAVIGTNSFGVRYGVSFLGGFGIESVIVAGGVGTEETLVFGDLEFVVGEVVFEFVIFFMFVFNFSISHIIV